MDDGSRLECWARIPQPLTQRDEQHTALGKGHVLGLDSMNFWQLKELFFFEFVPDPVCWTEVPEDWQTLRNQRTRWQRGLSESLTSHWGLMFSRRGGWPGWVAFPYMVIFEWLGPVVELLGYFWTCYAWWAGFISLTAFYIFFLVSLGLGILLSVVGVLLEQLSFQMYPKVSHMFKLVLVAIAENLGYRQLNAWWRIVGLYRWVTQKEAIWGVMKRKGSG